jgi:hypothetical protein
VEELALGWLHRDPVGTTHSRVEGYLGAGEPLRPPPLGNLLRIGHRVEYAPRRGLDDAGEFDGQLGGHGCDGSSAPPVRDRAVQIGSKFGWLLTGAGMNLEARVSLWPDFGHLDRLRMAGVCPGQGRLRGPDQLLSTRRRATKVWAKAWAQDDQLAQCLPPDYKVHAGRPYAFADGDYAG